MCAGTRVAVPERLHVAVAGASGFVGRALVADLLDDHHVIALGRSEATTEPGGPEQRRCDLYSLADAEAALEGVDVAVYLVHSMMPSSRLVQGSFEDLDLILADNFGRAAAARGVSRIVYLGGLLPDEGELSPHLASRAEVEDALGAHGVPVTRVRAGLVIGAGGSSLEILVKLVRRLPVMLCPSWTASRTQPVALEDVLAALRFVIDEADTAGRVAEIGGPDVLTYRELMAEAARALGLRRVMLPVPFMTPRLSRLWVTLFSGKSRALVEPLVESLRHEMVVHDPWLQQRMGRAGTPVAAALAASAEATVTPARSVQRLPLPAPARSVQRLPLPAPARSVQRLPLPAPARSVQRLPLPATARSVQRLPLPAPARSVQRLPLPATARSVQRLPLPATARSVQRLPLPPGRDAQDVAAEYVAWLPQLLRFVLRAEREGDTAHFHLPVAARPALSLTNRRERSEPTRALLDVTGGWLVRPLAGGRPRLEFRLTPDGAHVIAAVHEFHPTLPWFVYRWSQALVHLWVMRRFGAHLARLAPPAATPHRP